MFEAARQTQLALMACRTSFQTTLVEGAHGELGSAVSRAGRQRERVVRPALVWSWTRLLCQVFLGLHCLQSFGWHCSDACMILHASLRMSGGLCGVECCFSGSSDAVEVMLESA